MKKIIWVFGDSAVGKKTLIAKLINNDSKTKEELNLNNLEICACNYTIDNLNESNLNDTFVYDDTNMQEDNQYFNRKKSLLRRSSIMVDSLNFINGNKDILLIKGQDNDLSVNRGNILNYFFNNFGFRKNVEIEVWILSVERDEVWKQRIENKEWFQNFENKEEVMNKMILDRKSHAHENKLVEFLKEYNIPIVLIDSGEDRYSIISSDIRRR